MEPSDNDNVRQVLSRTRSKLSTVISRKATAQRDNSDIDSDEQRLDWGRMPDYLALASGSNSDVHTERQRKLGLTWTHLNVKGVSADACIQENTLSQFIPGRFKGSVASSEKKLRTIIESTSGCVEPGEMLLVLGRPGMANVAVLPTWSREEELIHFRCGLLKSAQSAGQPAGGFYRS